MKTIESERLWKQGSSIVLDGSSLLSRSPRISVDGFAPKYIQSTSGCRFTDVDNNTFIDYGMGVGSVLLGYGYINETVKKVIDKGNNLSLLSPLQVELATMLLQNISSCDKLKFLSTGSEATESAVRIARAFTGKDIVIRDDYHGWISWCSPLSGGVPKCYRDLTIKKDFNDMDVERYKKLLDGNNVACIILEPAKSQDMKKEERIQFLKQLKKECHKRDALLVFDEVACGYRFGEGGAQKFFHVTPDVSAFGKTVANGFPLSFVCCNEEVGDAVEGKVFISSTFGGNPVSLSAGIETVLTMKSNPVTRNITRFGEAFKEEINRVSKDYDMFRHIKIAGFPQRLSWEIPDWDLKSLLFQEFIKQGIFFTWEIKNSFSHCIPELEKTTTAFEKAIKVCKKALDENKVLNYLEGKPMKPIL